jgi:hypothetical protein
MESPQRWREGGISMFKANSLANQDTLGQLRRSLIEARIGECGTLWYNQMKAEFLEFGGSSETIEQMENCFDLASSRLRDFVQRRLSNGGFRPIEPATADVRISLFWGGFTEADYLRTTDMLVDEFYQSKRQAFKESRCK